jgi:hypothetical protein
MTSYTPHRNLVTKTFIFILSIKPLKSIPLATITMKIEDDLCLTKRYPDTRYPVKAHDIGEVIRTHLLGDKA